MKAGLSMRTQNLLKMHKKEKKKTKNKNTKENVDLSMTTDNGIYTTQSYIDYLRTHVSL